ncbi:MAG: hypothetical protein Q9162_004632 [Coniocarpon cinnabarinum]
MAKTNQSAQKRLLQEVRAIQDEPNPALQFLGPVNDDNLFEWRATMKGVAGTAYEGGLWNLTILIPTTYPLAAPTIRFQTLICHPNVHFKTGEICLDLLKTQWSPAYTIDKTLTSVHQLLTSAEPDSPLNVDIAGLMREGDLVGSESLVRFYTARDKVRSN